MCSIIVFVASLAPHRVCRVRAGLGVLPFRGTTAVQISSVITILPYFRWTLCQLCTHVNNIWWTFDVGDVSLRKVDWLPNLTTHFHHCYGWPTFVICIDSVSIIMMSAYEIFSSIVVGRSTLLKINSSTFTITLSTIEILLI